MDNSKESLEAALNRMLAESRAAREQERRAKVKAKAAKTKAKTKPTVKINGKDEKPRLGNMIFGRNERITERSTAEIVRNLVRETWKPTALVLLCEVRTCACCGREYTAPAGTYVERREIGKPNNRELSRLDAMQDGWLQVERLPRRVDYSHVTITACGFCFDLQDVITRKIAPSQLPLF